LVKAGSSTSSHSALSSVRQLSMMRVPALAEARLPKARAVATAARMRAFMLVSPVSFEAGRKVPSAPV
jgi:hypothetical protein